MIVKREGDGWWCIRQIDHADQAGELARSWRDGPYGPAAMSASLEYAARHHDLGWTDYDITPKYDPQEQGPLNFSQIDEATHTAFYGAAVRKIAETDACAAYLVSLHASGLYSRRYAWQGLKPVDWRSIGEAGERLLPSEREFRTGLVSRLPPEFTEFESAWRDYMLLETLDYLSLLTCFSFDSDGCGPVPTVPGQWAQLRVQRLGPWEVALDPFPFAGSELVVPVTARRLERPAFAGAEELEGAFAAASESQHETVYRQA